MLRAEVPRRRERLPKGERCYIRLCLTRCSRTGAFEWSGGNSVNLVISIEQRTGVNISIKEQVTCREQTRFHEVVVVGLCSGRVPSRYYIGHSRVGDSLSVSPQRFDVWPTVSRRGISVGVMQVSGP